MKKKKITIKDLAKRVGVSPGTVSKILTGKYKSESVKISWETIEKVKKLAKQLNYKPNYAARILSTGKTHTIGVYIPKSRKNFFYISDYYAAIIDALEKEAIKNGYDILLINYRSYLEYFDINRIDGLVIIEEWEMNDEIKALLERKLPFVIVNNLIENGEEIYSVNIDTFDAVEKVVNCFKENNHKNLAFIGELISTPQKEHIIRREYFKTILTQNQMPVNENLFLLGTIPGVSEKLNEIDFDQMSGYYGMEYLLKNFKGKFTGVFCANDLIALGALNYLYLNNVRFPKEISVIGFDDIDFAKYIYNGLTTIKQPCDIMGKYAFEILLKLLNHQEHTLKDKHIKIKTELLIRNTIAKLD